MAAAGIGEASAIAAFIHIGFSLATTLTTYIADVKDAPDEISSLATEIDATLRQVQELDNLLKDNDKTKGWNQNGVVLAQKCRTDAEKSIEKIVKLLKKTGTEIPENGTIERKDIDISLFRRVGWLRFKPQVTVVKQELERTRIDILLARDLYNVKSKTSTTAESSQAKDRLPALLKSKRRVKERLRRAQREQDRALSDGPKHVRVDSSPERDDQNSSSDEEEPPSHPRQRSRSPHEAPQRPQPYIHVDDVVFAYRMGQKDATRDLRGRVTHRRNSSLERNDNEPEDASSSHQPRAKRNDELIKPDANTAEEQRRQIETAERAAIERYQKTLVDDVTRTHELIKDMKETMANSFDPPLSEDQIIRFVEQQRAKLMTDEVAKIYNALPSAVISTNHDLEERPESEAETSIVSEVRKRNFFSRIFTGKSKYIHVNTVEYIEDDSSNTPETLVDSVNWASALLLLVSFDGSHWCITKCDHDNVTIRDSIVALEKKRNRRLTMISDTMRTHSQLPYECRRTIDNYLEVKRKEWNGKYEAEYELIIARSADKLPSKGLRMMRRLSTSPQIALPGQTFLMLYQRYQTSVKKLEGNDDKKEEDENDESKKMNKKRKDHDKNRQSDHGDEHPRMANQPAPPRASGSSRPYPVPHDNYPPYERNQPSEFYAPSQPYPPPHPHPSYRDPYRAPIPPPPPAPLPPGLNPYAYYAPGVAGREPYPPLPFPDRFDPLDPLDIYPNLGERRSYNSKYRKEKEEKEWALKEKMRKEKEAKEWAKEKMRKEREEAEELKRAERERSEEEDADRLSRQEYSRHSRKKHAGRRRSYRQARRGSSRDSLYSLSDDANDSTAAAESEAEEWLKRYTASNDGDDESLDVENYLRDSETEPLECNEKKPESLSEIERKPENKVLDLAVGSEEAIDPSG